MPSPSEFQIQRAVCIHLARFATPGVVWWHTPNGERRDAFTAGRLKDMGVKPGIHDLLLLHGGRLYGLELKADGRRTSAAQDECHIAMLTAGMAASVVADNLSAALAFLRTHGLVAA